MCTPFNRHPFKNRISWTCYGTNTQSSSEMCRNVPSPLPGSGLEPQAHPCLSECGVHVVSLLGLLCDIPKAWRTFPSCPSSVVPFALCRYDGEVSRGLYEGEGTAWFQGGHTYQGMLSGGLMHGRGSFTWSDGTKYEGDFVMNVPMGQGVYIWLDGSIYDGEVKDGMRHGLGTYTGGIKPVSYVGHWVCGKRHGKGTMYYNREKTFWYQGDWVNNIKEGWGTRRYQSGSIYEGQWQNNVRHGEGTMKWLATHDQYSGQWDNGIQHGQGTHMWFLVRTPDSLYPMRNAYVGEFVQGLRHGYGKFYYANGTLYDGEWHYNKKHGQGKFVFKNGRLFEGEFVEDRMVEFPNFSIDGINTPDISGIRTSSPVEDDTQKTARIMDRPSLLGSDIALEMSGLLKALPDDRFEEEMKQVEFAVLRHITDLRQIYGVYSRLGYEHSPDNTFLLIRLQFWRFLQDCGIHRLGLTVQELDRLLYVDETHSPFDPMLFRTFLSHIVVLAYHLHHKVVSGPSAVLASCFSKLMEDNVLPKAKHVEAFFKNHQHTIIAVNYIEKCWEIYRAWCEQSSSTWRKDSIPLEIVSVLHCFTTRRQQGIHRNQLNDSKMTPVSHVGLLHVLYLTLQTYALAQQHKTDGGSPGLNLATPDLEQGSGAAGAFLSDHWWAQGRDHL
uniref:Radial spoke head 10 homolog B n=1 Tax=Erpetoichthys calabaricus TaxID=27687 RepID=A0A8C4TD23_ERPCA